MNEKNNRDFFFFISRPFFAPFKRGNILDFRYRDCGGYSLRVFTHNVHMSKLVLALYLSLGTQR